MDTKKVIKVTLLILTVPTVALVGYALYKTLYKREPLFGKKGESKGSSITDKKVIASTLPATTRSEVQAGQGKGGVAEGGRPGAVKASEGRG